MKYMDGVLTDAEAVSLNRHIKLCGHCKEDFLAYDSIMRNFSEMALTEAPEGFESHVMDIVMQLPEVKAKFVNRSLSGILGVFSVLIGLGFILIMNKDAMISWLHQYPKLEPLYNSLAAVSAAVNNISLQVSAAMSQVSAYLQQAGSDLIYVPLLLFWALAAAQFIIYRRERTVARK